MLLARSRNLIFGGPVIALGLTGKSSSSEVRDNETYSAKRQFSDRNKGVLKNVQSPHKWWSTLKSAVFGSSSPLTPLVSGVWVWVGGNADLLSDNFDSKLSREAADLPLTCQPSPTLTTFAFRSSEVRRLLLDLDLYGGTETLVYASSFSWENCWCYGPPS